MPSAALETWASDGCRALDEIAAAHLAVGGDGPGRRYATREINHAYAVLLSSQFQRFCRDLHTESVAHFASVLSPAALRPVVRARLLEARKLDRGNPNPGNVGSDFARLGLDLWPALRKAHARNVNRQHALEKLSVWRNAIAHQDFGPAKLDPVPPLRLGTVKAWRRACEALAKDFDRVLRSHLTDLAGHTPWC